MPIWNKAATAQLNIKIAQGVVPTNPAELTNEYIYGTLSAIHFPEYHLTGPNAQSSVIRRFRKLFDNIQAENGLTGARRGKFLKIHFLIVRRLGDSLDTTLILFFSLSPRSRSSGPR